MTTRGHRHSVTPPGKHDGRKRIAGWTLGAAGLVGVGLLISLWLAPQGVERYADSLPIARAVLEEPDHVWPSVRGTAPAGDGGAEEEEEEEEARPLARADGSPLLPLPPSQPGFTAGEGEHDGIHYFEAVIGEASMEDPLPLVVVLHGRDGRAQLPGGPFLGITHPIRVLVPQAPDPLRDGFQWIPVYVNQGLVDELSSTLFRTASRVASLIRELSTARGVVGRPIVTGFSQGGIMTLALALHHDDVVGWAFPMSGWLPPPLEPAYRREDLRYPAIRAMHGAADGTVPIGPTLALFERLRGLEFDVDLEIFAEVEHTTTPQMNALFHEWLESAVCQAVDDEACHSQAEREAASILGRALPDAGMDAGMDAASDAANDATSNADADAEMNADPDAGPDSTAESAAPSDSVGTEPAEEEAPSAAAPSAVGPETGQTE